MQHMDKTKQIVVFLLAAVAPLALLLVVAQFGQAGCASWRWRCCT